MRDSPTAKGLSAMCDFLFHKIVPVLLGIFGVASIDTPGNFVRRIMLNMLDVISCYFQILADCLQ